MSKIALTILAVTSTLVLGGMVRANAATLTETYDFTATFGSGAPVSTWDGSITITFDPTNLLPLGPFAFAPSAFSSNLPTTYGTFVYSQGPFGLIFVGDNCSPGTCGVSVGTDEAVLTFFVNASGVATPVNAAIASTSTSQAFTATGTSVTLVPVPAALPLFATGLGGLGLLGWRRKRKSRAGMA